MGGLAGQLETFIDYIGVVAVAIVLQNALSLLLGGPGGQASNDRVIVQYATANGTALVVTDLDSTNGTVLNGNAIKKHFLQNNDVIELGKYKLKFVGEAAADINRLARQLIRIITAQTT